ncbi:LOW QUALITY PROTEIN: hypothetical protein PHMEG_00021935 [Phytophthora megakarya]|uniref:DDE-1 domain-containing protein n=1 Tax=Phytophthora megakarya TaxID=4795 RepID=A0A225VMY8_9STRA|nr:LOW QUALITY PROTEIN: hypothetical protein PHMEG_00021935 [Phytophthora megakarya]
MDEKLLLLWDDFSAHWTEEVVAYATSVNVIIMRVPPRYTYVCQPADIAWNMPFKCRLRSKWVECLRRQISNHHSSVRRHTETVNEVSQRVSEVARAEIQEVAQAKIAHLQQSLPHAAFQMEAPKRRGITSWIMESWNGLGKTTICFAQAELLGDNRSAEAITIEDDVEQMRTLINRLADLSGTNDAVESEDEFVSSDSSDDEN